jgi:hypothetical protein
MCSLAHRFMTKDLKFRQNRFAPTLRLPDRRFLVSGLAQHATVSRFSVRGDNLVLTAKAHRQTSKEPVCYHERA